MSIWDNYGGGVKPSGPKLVAIRFAGINYTYASTDPPCRWGTVLTGGIDLRWSLVHTYSHVGGRCSMLRQHREIFLTVLQSSPSLLLSYSIGSSLVQDDCACVCGRGVLIMHTCILLFS